MENLVPDLVYTYLVPALMMIVASVITRAGLLISKKTGIEIDAGLAASMHAAIERYLRKAMTDLGIVERPAKPDEIADLVAGATKYIEKMNPDSFARFGIERVAKAAATKISG